MSNSLGDNVRLLVMAAVALSSAAMCLAGDTSSQGTEFFERHIRPLLMEHCIECHGGKTQIKGEFRLTSRASLIEGGESGPAVISGEPVNSLLMEAVRHEGLKMPPTRRLEEKQIEHLETWIELGLPWPDNAPELVAGPSVTQESHFTVSDEHRAHWAFQPIKLPKTPAVPNDTWSRGQIDRWILVSLLRHRLVPSEAASKPVLLRRATFDLTGLPPTPSELASFTADSSPEAFSRQIDRLLASPAYGERWGRFWLDVARYADNKGYAFEEESNMNWAYTYRDYVVRAFNTDLPYDRFIVEQLAADQLPLGTDRRPLAALGFVTCGGLFLKNVPDIVDDRIDVVTRGMLGLTVSCARCHDHKFDPVPAADYYSLYGVFSNSIEPIVPPLIVDPPRTEQYAAFEAELHKHEQNLDDFLHGKLANVVQGARRRVGEYLLAAYQQRGKPKIEDFMLIADAEDLNPMMLAYYQAYLAEANRVHSPIFAPWHALTAIPEEDFAERSRTWIAHMQTLANPSQPVNPWVIKALTKEPLLTVADLAGRYGQLLVAIDDEWHQTLESATKANLPTPIVLPDPDRELLRQVLYGPDAPANGQFNLFGYEIIPDRPSQDARKKLYQAIMECRAKEPGLPPRAMTLVDLQPIQEPYVFLRGNPNQRGRTVPRQFLQVLSPTQREPFKQAAGRLELAQAIADEKNPLTARVIVNRIWQYHFGVPLVSTPSDFGLRSAPPSHPELLDYLAASLMQHGWSIKTLHREIMMSAAYQQLSDDREGMHAIDPENVMLWRFNRRRLDFEAMRDSLLEVANRLDRTMGGVGTKDLASAETTRRTLYCYVDREYLPGLYRTFDFPSPDTSSPQRSQTTVPQQSLFWMNSPLVNAAAKHLLARSDVSVVNATPSRVQRLYELLFSRAANLEEVQFAEQFVGDQPTHADWMQYAQGLLLTNEFIFVD
ncbi:MAG: PSD1 and planctomycete cytochrome C domain-containing protein [Planctomycetota bacterium]|nr:PSD1 and planctomycete cytochrome C domain-containing protein [Planctomycetota bacterium]MDA1177686.1 PSD1 and planctomycete cytochrome C domain-containing protein [Planctomycetota bacterium]